MIRYLVDNEPRNPDEKKTPGTAIHDRIATTGWCPKQSDVKLNIWDFGGQDIYHNIHRYFLTERSLYLLVLEDRRENDRSIYRWLKTIRDRAGDAPILVVINKSEEGKSKLQLDETGLKEEYYNILGFLRTACDDNDWSRQSIQDLRERILLTLEDDRLKHVYDKVSEAFLRVKKDIIEEAKQNKVLTQPRFAEICTHGLDGEISENLSIPDEAEQRSILSILDHLGVVVAKGYDRDAPLAVSHVNLLDPTWLTDAIYTILTKTKESMNNGEFRREQLNDWLNPEEYTRVHQDYILEMMQEKDIGLCFPLPDIESLTYLVPEALPTNRPHLKIADDALRFRYRYNILPEGLIPRFIVEANRYLPKDCHRWRTGVSLEIENCYVVVQGNIDKKLIDISIEHNENENSRRQALAIVRDKLEAVHESHNEIEPKSFVPLPDNPEVEISYKRLLYLESKYGSDRMESEIEIEYRVGDLLDGVGRSKESYAPPLKKTKDHTNTIPALTLNHSYSWPFYAGFAALTTMLFTFLMLVLSPEWKILIGIPILAGAVAGLTILIMNPEWIFRRLLSITVLGGVLGQVIGKSLELHIPGFGKLNYNDDTSNIALIVCGVLGVCFIAADLIQTYWKSIKDKKPFTPH